MMTMYDENTALQLLKIRLNRLQIDENTESYMKARLSASENELIKKGITLESNSTDDLMLLVDDTAFKYQNRDKSGAMPEWLNIAIRERWLAQKGGGGADT